MEFLRDRVVVLQFDCLYKAGFVAVGFLVHHHADAGVDACVAGEGGSAVRSEIWSWSGERQVEEGEEGEGERFHGFILGFLGIGEGGCGVLCFV